MARRTERRVKGSPHFYCGDSVAFCPTLEISKDRKDDLEVSANLDVLDAFLTKLFRRVRGRSRMSRLMHLPCVGATKAIAGD